MQLTFVDNNVIGVDLPSHVILKVVHTEPGLRGDTATNVLKPATLETGASTVSYTHLTLPTIYSV